MAILPQPSLFSWKNVENLGDLKRLELVLLHLPDEPLMRALETHRGNGRDDYPVRAMWNSLLAAVVYQHESVASLGRELLRNGQLRDLCGLDPLKSAEAATPTASAYTRFFSNLFAHQELIEEMFDEVVESLRAVLPEFGRRLAMDSTAVATHARPRGKEKVAELEMDGRRDLEADFGVKRRRVEEGKDSLLERVTKWFGYKLHLIVDASYELPVAYEVTRASAADNRTGKAMVSRLDVTHPELTAAAETLAADRGYDDGALLERLWEAHGIKPVIDVRDLWKDGQETRVVPGTVNVVYDYRGQVYCHCRGTGVRRRMSYWGYERDRDAQKWRCPAAVYGYECASRCRCGGGAYGRVVRVPRSTDRRVFTPLARASLAFERHYAERSAVERVNSRLSGGFGLERHFVRGLAKMRLRCSLLMLVMVGMALGRVREQQEEKLRSLVAAA